MTGPRVVSLVPSATETIRAWGIDPIAVTRFCEQPDLVAVGGTKDPDLATIVDLRPDLVVMCVEENRLEDARTLEAAGLEVFAFDIDGVDDVEPQLSALADRLHVTRHPPPIGAEPARVDLDAFVPIWRRPWMSLQSGTYGSDLLRRIGIGNIFADEGVRYPEITLAQASDRHPDVVIAPSEPYPFSERHRVELEAVAPVVFVDGQDLFWWGVRTPTAIARLPREQLVRD